VNILADESVEHPIILRLRAVGHRVASIAESKSGAADEEVLAIANREESILLTADKDFGTLVYLMRRANHGVVLYRLHGRSTYDKCEIVAKAFQERAQEFLGSFTVVSPYSVRVRPLHPRTANDDDPA
jgi:predicted nuclease of predicted toxin-antitoxin system